MLFPQKTETLKLEQELATSPYLAQIAQVKAILSEEKLIHESRVDAEVDWFYLKLGVDTDYFKTTPAPIVARY